MKKLLCWLVAGWIGGSISGHATVDASAPVKPGVRKMEQRLREIVRTEDVMKNPFRNRERAELLKARIASETDAFRIWQLLPQLADEQLKAGDPRGALATYDRFDQLTASSRLTLEPKHRQMIQHERAVCYLRIGEQ